MSAGVAQIKTQTQPCRNAYCQSTRRATPGAIAEKLIKVPRNQAKTTNAVRRKKDARWIGPSFGTATGNCSPGEPRRCSPVDKAAPSGGNAPVVEARIVGHLDVEAESRGEPHERADANIHAAENQVTVLNTCALHLGIGADTRVAANRDEVPCRDERGLKHAMGVRPWRP